MPTGQRDLHGNKQKITRAQMAEALQAYLQHKSMKQAGQSLNLTSTGVALRIQRLEETYGRMLERRMCKIEARRIPKLTQTGRQFLDHFYSQ